MGCRWDKRRVGNTPLLFFFILPLLWGGIGGCGGSTTRDSGAAAEGEAFDREGNRSDTSSFDAVPEITSENRPRNDEDIDEGSSSDIGFRGDDTSGSAAIDEDGDGYFSMESGGDDCNDKATDIGPPRTWHMDADGDGYGHPTNTESACQKPPGYVLDGNDCDDDRVQTHPEAEEICDGADNDCDGDIDEMDEPDFYCDECAPWCVGADCYALKFDGSDDEVVIGNTDEFAFDSGENFSINVWIKAPQEQVDLDASTNSIVNMGFGGESGPFFIQITNKTHSELSGKIKAVRGSPAPAAIIYSQSSVNDGLWHHVNFTKSGDVLRLSIDGAFEAEGADLPDLDTSHLGGLSLGSRKNGIAIGPKWDRFFKGSISQVAIYARALSDAEIIALMNGGPSALDDDEGLVGYWPLSTGFGNNVFDLSSTERHGTIFGATWASQKTCTSP